jgi:hypothetical protein
MTTEPRGAVTPEGAKVNLTRAQIARIYDPRVMVLKGWATVMRAGER